MTLTAGVRLDGLEGILPSQSSPPGRWVDERRLERRDVLPDWGLRPAPRLGVVIDLTGDARTVMKASYGQSNTPLGPEVLEAVNSNGFSEAVVAWSDRDSDGSLHPGELGPFTGFIGGATTRFDANARRPLTRESSLGFERQLSGGIEVSATYYRRDYINGLGLVDAARPPSAYQSVTRAYVDPETKLPRAVTVFDLDPELRGVRNHVLTDVRTLESTHHTLEARINRRFQGRWSVSGVVVAQRHRGFLHNGAVTLADFNDPNVRLNRDGASLLNDSPWIASLVSNHRLPLGVNVSMLYAARGGQPLARLTTVSGLVQVSEEVHLVPRGTDRTETVMERLDLGLARRFAVSNAQLDMRLDILNVFNANHVLNQVERIGSAWRRPYGLLDPRAARLRITFQF
jgi:hypothetical protein